jgi:uncharacterized SAM-binding protein YcdF (DUF218 family)
MNDWLVHWGIEAFKPLVSRLLLPPASLLLLALLAWLLARRLPRTARVLGLLSLAALWLLCTSWVAHHLQRLLLPSPPALSAAAVERLSGQPHTAVVVLGAGRRSLAVEYGGPDLTMLTMERLRYGAWLARQTRLPLAYSGGIGHGAVPGGATEAEAARAALARDGGPPLRWAESRSRDTNENAVFSVAMLQAEGVQRIVLVTHDFHQPRALAAFRRAIARSGQPMDLAAAPMGQRGAPSGGVVDFLPSAEGLQRSSWVLHEWLGRLAGA